MDLHSLFYFTKPVCFNYLFFDGICGRSSFRHGYPDIRSFHLCLLGISNRTHSHTCTPNFISVLCLTNLKLSNKKLLPSV